MVRRAGPYALGYLLAGSAVAALSAVAPVGAKPKTDPFQRRCLVRAGEAES